MVDTINGKTPKPGRNEPCACGSSKKYKKCCGAPPSEERPPCSVDECEQPIHWFLAPSIDGVRVADRYWVACRDHAQAIAAGAAEHGMDVHVIPFDSLMGKSVGPVDPVAGPGAKDAPEALAARMRAAQDEIMANTIFGQGEHKGQKYRDVYGEPPYARDGEDDVDSEPTFEPPRIWTPPGVR